MGAGLRSRLEALEKLSDDYLEIIDNPNSLKKPSVTMTFFPQILHKSHFNKVQRTDDCNCYLDRYRSFLLVGDQSSHDGFDDDRTEF